MPTVESPQPINLRTLHGIGQLLKAEARGLWRTCWRAFWRTTLIVAVPAALYFLQRVFSFGLKSVGDALVSVLMCLAVALFQGALVGLVGAVLAGSWRLCGGWMFVPVVITPFVFVGLGWLFSGLVEWQMDNILDAIHMEAQQHGLLSSLHLMDLGGIHGEVAVVLLALLLPFLLIDALLVLLSAKVLLHLALLALLVGGLFLLAAVLTGVLCLPVLGWSLVKRLRARHVFGSAPISDTGGN